MTIEEEIQNLIDKQTGIDNYGSLGYQVGVCNSVILADETIIEKACNWLREQKEMIGISFQEDFIEIFKMAMKK